MKYKSYIKLFEKELKQYRKDTFITSFFATITVLILVIIILNCGLVSNAQSISGGSGDSSYSYDSSDLKNWLTFYPGIDLNQTNPTGVLCLSNNPDYFIDNTNYPGLGTYNPIPTNAYYFSNTNSSLDGIFDGTTTVALPESFSYGGSDYNIDNYNKFYFFVWSSGGYASIVVSNSSVSSVQDSYRKWYQPLGTDTFIFYYPNGVTSNPVIKRPYQANISGHGVDGDVLILNNSYYDSLLYSNSSITGEFFELTNNNGAYRIVTHYNECEFNYLDGQTGNGGITSSSNETADNNLVIPDADWTFQNTKYVAPYNNLINTGSVYPNGNVTFTFNPTQYQKEHSSDFYLTFTFKMDYSVTYKNTNSNDTPPFYKTSALLDNTKTYSHIYNYLNSDDSSIYLDVPLSDFISDGNSKAFTFEELFKSLDGFSGVLLQSKEIDELSYNKFNLYCTAFINSGSSSSGNYEEWYNPMSKKGLTTDKSGNINNNPYIDNGNSDPDSSNTPTNNENQNAPGDAGNNGSNSSSTASTGAITINNTNNNNWNNTNTLSNDGNTFSNVFQSLIGSNKITSENIAETSGTNGFVGYLNSTISSVPSTFFTALLGYFVTCIAILIVAFVLRMLLDIL